MTPDLYAKHNLLERQAEAHELVRNEDPAAVPLLIRVAAGWKAYAEQDYARVHLILSEAEDVDGADRSLRRVRALAQKCAG